MAWLVEEDGEVEKLSERDLREQLRDGDLTGVELARPDDDPTWRPLHTWPLFREEVPHVGDPATAARRRKVRDFGVHAFAYAAVNVAIGFAPQVLILWGIGLFFHGAGAFPALRALARDGKLFELKAGPSEENAIEGGAAPRALPAEPAGEKADASAPVASSPRGASPAAEGDARGRGDAAYAPTLAPGPRTPADEAAHADTAYPEGGARGARRSAEPERVGRYRIQGRLGEGGMGVVFRALDEILDRPVAIKILSSGRGGSGRGGDEGPSRLQREARAMARLSHPSVATIFDVGETEGQLFIAMELIEGPTLREWLERPRGAGEILRALVQASEGVAAAHAAGLVHRDFKPENVMIGDDGRTRVTDFGLAKADDAGDGLTRTGAVLGTPRYMAPEQLRGEPADARADQFAVGAVFFEALYGVHPYEPEDDRPLARAILAGARREPPPRADVPAAARAAILRAVDPDAEARHRSIEAFVEALGPLPADQAAIAGLASSIRQMLARRDDEGRAGERFEASLRGLESAIAELDARAGSLAENLRGASPAALAESLARARVRADEAEDESEREAARGEVETLEERLEAARRAERTLAALRSRREAAVSRLEALHLELTRAEAEAAPQVADLQAPLDDLRTELEAASEVEELLRP